MLIFSVKNAEIPSIGLFGVPLQSNAPEKKRGEKEERYGESSKVQKSSKVQGNKSSKV